MNEYQNIRVAVLGASGFLGRWVARELCAQNCDVYLAVRNEETARKVFARYGIKGQLSEFDLRNSEALRQFFATARPAITFNLAGYGVDPAERDEKTAYEINEALVKTVCTMVSVKNDIAWKGQQIVHVGSALEYGTAGGDLNELSLAQPTTMYGQSKLAGTLALADACAAINIRGVTARLFTVYGPGEHAGRLLPSLRKSAESGEPIALTAGNQRRDFAYVAEIAEGLLRLGLSSSKPGEIVNLATGRLTSVRDFAETAAAVLGIPKERLTFGAVATRPEEMVHEEASLERLRQLTSWQPSLTIRDGVRRTQGFFEASPMTTEALSFA
jgi:nucleoside-diphosphate-sugar epimerase